jgi:formylglycine-generating enzyme required for sulfatase activity
MLALGSDAALKAAAIKDLRGADSADEQAAIGDAWWDLAETKQGEERDTLRLRAGYWYRQAEPNLSGGLARLKIKQRLEEISKFGREIPAASHGPAGAREPPLAIAPFNERTAKQHQTAWAKHLKVPVLWTNTIGIRFVLIPPGEFDMGSTTEEVARFLEEAKAKNLPNWYVDRLPSEAPKHRVRISKPFYLGISEVTQTEYERVMGSNPSKFKGDMTRPVEWVNWDEASAFCRKLGELPPEQTARAAYRLPTEAEWEYACRAGATSRFSFGENAEALTICGWWEGTSQGRTQPVGRLRPNAWGLYDMHGNVWEWCHDWWANDYYGMSPREDPSGPSAGSQRVGRGGSWGNGASGCRASSRYGHDIGARDESRGFRVVRQFPSFSP